MSQIIIHSKFGKLECKPMVFADLKDSTPEDESSSETTQEITE